MKIVVPVVPILYEPSELIPIVEFGVPVNVRFAMLAGQMKLEPVNVAVGTGLIFMLYGTDEVPQPLVTE